MPTALSDGNNITLLKLQNYITCEMTNYITKIINWIELCSDDMTNESDWGFILCLLLFLQNTFSL